MKAFYRLFYYISIVLTSILAGVTIAGAFVGNAAPDSFKFMPFIGLVLPILLLANLASAIYSLAVLGFHPSDCYIQQLGVYELCITIAFFQSGFVTDG